MAQNSLYPGYVTIYYSSNNHPHEMTFGITNPLGGINSSTIQNKGGTANSTGAAMLTWVNVIKLGLASNAVFKYWELYKMASPTADPIMIDTGILNVAGTGSGAVVAYSQEIFSYRSELGGTGKIYLMEQQKPVNLVINPTFIAGSLELAVATYMTGSTCVITARDGGFPMVVTKATTKTNDALRAKYVLEQG